MKECLRIANVLEHNLSVVMACPSLDCLENTHIFMWLGMCGETSAILVVVAADFFFDRRHLEVPTDVIVRHIPRCIDDYAQGL
jgi:hypothetical protein